MARKPKEEKIVTEIQEIGTNHVGYNVLGTSPLIVHRYPFKAWQELVLPSRKENRAALEQTLKHMPVEEYRECFYRNRDDKRPTLFHLPNGMFAGALAQAGVDVPGAARATLQRLTRVVDINIDLYGIPELFCAMVRNSGMNRAPDVRTRPIFPQWACRITVRYCVPQLTERNITHLMGAAGMIVGVGDWRGERGGPYGAFKVVEDGNPEFEQIVKKQGRKPQTEVYNHPIFHDEDTTQLMTWFEQELARREQDQHPTQRRHRGRNGKAEKPPKTGRRIVVRGSESDEKYVGEEA